MPIANPQRGEVEITVNDKPYVLKLSMNAACALEKRLGKRIGQLLNEAGQLEFTAMRELVWMLLQKHHRDEFRSTDQVGEFIDDAGGVGVFFVKLKELAEVNVPDDVPKDGTALEGGEASRPLTAA